MLEESFGVVVTEGDRRLGGDDMDGVLLQVVLRKLSDKQLMEQQRQCLLPSCRHGKELLCGGGEGSSDAPPAASSWTTTIDGTRIQVSRQEFNDAIQS